MLFGIIIILTFFTIVGFIIGWSIYEEFEWAFLYGASGTTLGFGVILLLHIIDIIKGLF